MSVIDATEAAAAFNRKLTDYSLDWVRERLRHSEPLSELTDDHIRWVVLSDLCALIGEGETESLRRALHCDPASYAVGFVFALLDASRRIAAGSHAQRRPRASCARQGRS